MAEAVHTGTRPVPLDELIPFPGNARHGNVGSIRASVRANGQYRSLIVWDDGGTLIVLAGNHTLAALRAEGHTEARCEIVECDERTAIRINLADNRLAELGGYDEPALADLLGRLGGETDGTGYEREQVTDLLAARRPDLAAASAPPLPEPAFEPAAETRRLDQVTPRPCPRCGYDTANNPDRLPAARTAQRAEVPCRPRPPRRATPAPGRSPSGT